MHRLYQTAFCRNEDIGKTSMCENALAALLTLKEKIISGYAATVGSTSLNKFAKPRDTVFHLTAKDAWMEDLDLEGFQFGGKQDPRCKRHNRSRNAVDPHLRLTTLSASLRELVLSTKSALPREAPRGLSAAIPECVSSRLCGLAALRPPISVMETPATAAVSVLRSGLIQRLFA